MYAVMQANIQMVSLLIESGANIHAKDKAGRTALDLAKIYADPTRLYADVYAEIVKVLEDAAKRQQPKKRLVRFLQSRRASCSPF